MAVHADPSIPGHGLPFPLPPGFPFPPWKPPLDPGLPPPHPGGILSTLERVDRDPRGRVASASARFLDTSTAEMAAKRRISGGQATCKYTFTRDNQALVARAAISSERGRAALKVAGLGVDYLLELDLTELPSRRMIGVTLTSHSVTSTGVLDPLTGHSTIITGLDRYLTPSAVSVLDAFEPVFDREIGINAAAFSDLHLLYTGHSADDLGEMQRSWLSTAWHYLSSKQTWKAVGRAGCWAGGAALGVVITDATEGAGAKLGAAVGSGAASLCSDAVSSI